MAAREGSNPSLTTILLNQMNKLLVTLALTVSMYGQAQTYRDSVSFKSDLWTILSAEEAVRSEGDTIGVTWVTRTVKARKNVIYIDVSKSGTLVGIKYPRVLKLSSEGLPNNGFIGERWYSPYNMHIQTYAKDEIGNVWLVSIGKDRLTPDLNPDPKDQGRIYLTIHDTRGLQSGWYFVINTLGKQR
jgi:hypothetical protein